MSARSKRGAHVPESPMTATQKTTPTATTAPSATERHRQRSASPLNISRSEEKEELAELNNRLASYIDYVRKLETDKDNLKRKIKTFTEERLVRLSLFCLVYSSILHMR